MLIMWVLRRPFRFSVILLAYIELGGDSVGRDIRFVVRWQSNNRLQLHMHLIATLGCQ